MGFFSDAGHLTVTSQFIGDDGQIFDLNSFSYSVGHNAVTSVYDFASELPRYPGNFNVRSIHYMFWSSPADHDQIYYDNFRYTKGSGEEYSTLDSNLMYSLFDVNYFYWGEAQ